MQQQHYHGYEQEQAQQSYQTIEQKIDFMEYVPSSESDPQQYERNNSYQQGYHQQMTPPQYAQQQPQYHQQYVPPAMYMGYPRFGEPSMDGKILAAISYLGFWLTGLIMLLFVRENRFIRFHAMQSLLFFGGINVIYFIFAFFVHMHFFPFFFAFPFFLGFILANIVGCIGWFVGIIGAFSGKFVKLPFVGDLADRSVNGQVSVK
ncbi:MAG TPA: hypothetical protein VFB12_17930 [Ktedonobacteraceae bacterium]|nr:hypothetical protein [Ktedonobacteraceae bacterium]